MIRPAAPSDLDTIAALIRELAEYEHLAHEVVLDADELRDHLFGPRPYAEVLIAESDAGEPVGFALFFHNFSTFLGRPGIHLEDLFVRPEHRGAGHGIALLPRYTAGSYEGVVVKRLSGVTSKRHLHVLLRPDRAERPSVRAVVDALREEAKAVDARFSGNG